ncbi:TonB-dependent receptor [Accumulibacter sp.]|uniref:TonB-dependent receptor n=1 Tax=Accumulibacter sp. TaxID=2053492 RepID=UPI0025FBD581|nr:TonB-dependent receptor [Accumulibacter sp.]MCM8594352.1 TonB-dependent receptor [Accumulibacter sp.]MCM8625013.1 TonB-dependent receptor [Accumulibacter sp.]MDS4048496.1 TonB-dependent receptor [Accumulibacter sp.]
MQPPLTPLAAALVLAFATAAQADPLRAEEPDAVIVTASRFKESDTNVPASVSVITRDDIRNTPAYDLPSMLKGSAGVGVRALTGSLGIDATVDIRGFGEAAGSNTLILLDGQRMNPIDSGSVSWSAIPLDSVQRIEIQRGAGTVMYGDKATGGVVNIITDKSGTPRAGITVGLGSSDTQTVSANGAIGNEAGYANAFAGYSHTGGWRQNSQAELAALSGRGALYVGQGEAFLDYAVYDNRSGQPGALLRPAYLANPQSSSYPNDSQNSNGYRLRPGVALPITDTLRLEAEVSYDRQDQHADYVSFGSKAQRVRDTWSVTPRLRWQHGFGSLKSETVAGLDYYSGQVDANYSTAATQEARQTSTGAYIQNVTEWLAGLASTVGFRSQRVDQSASQDAYNGFYGLQPAMNGSADYTRNAWDLGLSYAGDGWRTYARGGTTFRFANTDELFSYDPFTGNPTFAGNLKPQTGTLGEIGGSFMIGPVSGRAAVYRIDLEDEIVYDGAVFSNVNLDKTRRQGVELEGDWRIVPSIFLRLTYTYADSTFRSGPYTGNQIPLVPTNKAAARLTWNGAQFGTYTAVVNYVGSQYYSGDFANALDKLPGYTTADFMASWNFKPWSVTARVLNAFDKVYSPYAGYSAFQSDYYYYPADGRSFLMTASYNFR